MASGLFQEARERDPEFGEELIGLHRLRFGVLLFSAVTDDAALDVIGEQLDPERIERGTDGGDLIENVHAITVVLNHPFDSIYLSSDPIHALRYSDLYLWLHNKFIYPGRVSVK
jgi:hypothetical protein